ncbi:MAG: hypothetical protein J0H12_05880 [Candidatus Paracaedimonas acanthamoebae]|uniref:Uncharacterized protein n=1 Tax=Candidatus Paracaedimonas acanthamoebae TaxID=244581 RepID=A0A8J7Q1J9_9PROT|nr:hypothetical protein [Candidatus Paracaedimonas acanthamoebae]
MTFKQIKTFKDKDQEMLIEWSLRKRNMMHGTGIRASQMSETRKNKS